MKLPSRHGANWQNSIVVNCAPQTRRGVPRAAGATVKWEPLSTKVARWVKRKPLNTSGFGRFFLLPIGFFGCPVFLTHSQVAKNTHSLHFFFFTRRGTPSQLRWAIHKSSHTYDINHWTGEKTRLRWKGNTDRTWDRRRAWNLQVPPILHGTSGQNIQQNWPRTKWTTATDDVPRLASSGSRWMSRFFN